jgi:hypothetical protein
MTIPYEARSVELNMERMIPNTTALPIFISTIIPAIINEAKIAARGIPYRSSGCKSQ